MRTRETMPTRESILARGFPEGFIEHYRQQAEAERARAMGAFLAALWRGLSGAVSKETSWARRLA